MIGPIAATLLTGITLIAGNASAQQPLRLYAAGSLRVALTELATAFTKHEGIPVETEFGASGLVRERIEKGPLRTYLRRRP